MNWYIGCVLYTYLNIIKEAKYCMLALDYPYENSNVLNCNSSGGKNLGFYHFECFYLATLLIVTCKDVEICVDNLVHWQESPLFTFVA
jgi:hypothetical protein